MVNINLNLNDLLEDAKKTLEGNWNGKFTIPSATLYPHQWSWDTAFKSIGNSYINTDRAIKDLKYLFNAQWKNGMVPHIVFNNKEIANGDLSYKKSAECWFQIIQPFKSKMKIAMGAHDYTDTSGGIEGVINQYLKPLNLAKTYYSFDMNNVHVTVIDPYIDYGFTSAQYLFIENDLKTASINPNIDWIFAVESTPMYTSPSKHAADSTIRDTYHPLFDKYGVDIVLSSDNHNYQRTFPLKYNKQSDSSKPIITDKNQNNYNGDYLGQIYLITGTAGRSHYELEGQAPFVTKQDDKQFGFLNIDINTNNTSLTGTFYSNENGKTLINNMNVNNRVIDQFTIFKIK